VNWLQNPQRKKATIQNDRTRNHPTIEKRHEFLREQGVNQGQRADEKGEDPRGVRTGSIFRFGTEFVRAKGGNS
jgi:hypothetical protein